MDLFMKQRSKQAANILIYHTVAHSHTIQSSHSLQMSSLLQKVKSHPHLSLFYLETLRINRHTYNTLHSWRNHLLLCTHTKLWRLYYERSKMTLVWNQHLYPGLVNAVINEGILDLFDIQSELFVPHLFTYVLICISIVT